MMLLKLLLATALIALTHADTITDEYVWFPTTMPWDPINYWRPAKYPTCGTNKACPTGMICNVYPPCQQGYCEACQQPEYFPAVTADFNFTCIHAMNKVGASCTPRTCYQWSSCNPTTSKCTCPAGSLPNGDNTMCVQMTNLQVKVGSPCTASLQCGANANCKNGNCTCYNGYTPDVDGFNCSALEPGDSCDPNTACVPSDTIDCDYMKCDSATMKWNCTAGYKYTYTDLTGPMCVAAGANLNQGLGAQCSYEEPFDNVCSTHLNCQSCPEVSGNICQDAAVPTAVTPNPTTVTPKPGSATTLTHVTALLLTMLLVALVGF